MDLDSARRRKLLLRIEDCLQGGNTPGTRRRDNGRRYSSTEKLPTKISRDARSPRSKTTSTSTLDLHSSQLRNKGVEGSNEGCMAQDEQQAAFSPIVRQHSRTSSQFANNLGLSLSPLTTTAPSLPSPTLAAEPRRDHDHEAAAARRRSNPFTSVDPTLTTRPRSGTTTPALPPTDPWTPAQSAFPSTSTSLAQFIQTKRRQASAPYFASARSSSLFSPGAGFSLGPEALHPEPPEAATQTDSPPASRNRSRASSRRATATGGLTPLRTHGLESFAQIAQHDDAGLVPTPTIEEWRQLGSDLNALADLRVEDGDQDPTPKRTQPKWKRWPSLNDDYDDDDDDDASSSGGEDQADDFRLSLSLSALGKYKQNHHLPQVPPSGRGEEHQHHDQQDEEDDQDDDSPRPSYKSSFSYSSSGFGSTGGFVNHSNTRSIHSATSNSSSPDPGAAVFTETTPTHVSRPSLSRGSLSTATGGLSSTPSPPESSSTDSLTDLATATTTSSASTSRQAKKPGPLKVPLPPNVYRSLEEGEGSFATSRSSLDDFDSAAATPFDGDPFASTAPAGTAVPPTPYYGAGDNKKRRSSVEAGLTAVDLDWTKPLGPVDPRTYSAITGLRDIRSFVCEQDEAGKGAYGSVRRARERGPDGKPIGVSSRVSVPLPPATADGDPPPAARTDHQVRHQATDPRRLLEEAQDPRPDPDRGARPRPPPTGPVRASTTVELYRAEAEQLLEPLQGSAPAERLGSEIGPVARGRRWRDRPDGAPQHLPAPRLLGGFRVLLSRGSRRRSIRFCDREN